METNSLKINEIFASIFGEGTYSGIPGVIVRLTGCNLRCSYCDTTHAYENGIEMTVDQVMRMIGKYNLSPVLITGGEPLLQEPVYELMNRLIDEKYGVLVETNGSILIDRIPGEVVTVLDLKCPGSGECHRNVFTNLDYISEPDNVKFVIRDRTDYEWAVNVIDEYGAEDYSNILISPVHGALDPKELAEWMLADQLYARISLQLHKIIWGPEERSR